MYFLRKPRQDTPIANLESRRTGGSPRLDGARFCMRADCCGGARRFATKTMVLSGRR